MKYKYYSLKNIMKNDCEYYVIFGERSNGKTYAVLEYILTNFVKSGYQHQAAVIRRTDLDFKQGRGDEYFANLVGNGLVKKLTNGQWEDIRFQRNRWYLCRYDENGKRELMDTPIAYAFYLTGSEHDKGSGYPGVKTILFDEFIGRHGYLTDEYVLFTNTLATIIRLRDDIKIFMLGNTVNKYCPYFGEMGLTHVKQMKHGDIDLYEYGEQAKTRVAVEYTEPNVQGKPSDKYFAFDNPKLKMITRGEWEIAVYPHLPTKYKPKNVVFEFYVEFDGEWLHADIVSVDGNNFIYLYPKKERELKDPARDYLFSDRYSERPNIKRNILFPGDKISRKIYELVKSEKVFYQSNEIGEIFRNYLIYCKEGVIRT